MLAAPRTDGDGHRVTGRVQVTQQPVQRGRDVRVSRSQRVGVAPQVVVEPVQADVPVGIYRDQGPLGCLDIKSGKPRS